MKPPNIIFLTPNGRFATNQKICLSISAYHPESWNPAWGGEDLELMPSHADGDV